MFNKKCQHCDAAFTAKNNRSLYCSIKCKNKFKSESIMAKRRNHQEDYNAYQRKWRVKNREHCRAWERDRYADNDDVREAKKNHAKQWAKKHPERKKHNQRVYYQANWFKFQERNAAKRDRTLPAELIREVMEFDDYTCQYCGCRGGKLTIDHKIPVSRGGTDDRSNLCVACLSCNCSKGAKTVKEFLIYRKEIKC
jgi:hypothetical protein